MILQNASSLAHLPRPFGDGQTQCSTVHGLVRSKKRKRYEIAAAVDGEGVNIYDVQDPKLVTSYATPPQSSFTCPPCSVVTWQPRKARRTYLSLESHLEAQLKCFVEEAGSPSATLTDFTRRSSAADDPIIFLDTIYTPQRDEPDIIVIHKDTSIERLSSDLQQQRWSVNAAKLFGQNVREESSSHFTLAAYLVSFEDAQKSLLKSREDILAGLLGYGDKGLEQCSVLLLVTSTRHTSGESELYGLHCFATPHQIPESGRLIPGNTQAVRYLTSWQVPRLAHIAQKSTIRFSLHPSSGHLTLTYTHGLINIDLTGSKPLVSSDFRVEKEEFSSVVRLSESLAVAATPTAIKIYDVNFQSLQGLIRISDITDTGKKRKHGDENAMVQPMTFITFFQKPKILTAICDGRLIAIDFTSASTTGLAKQGLLINSIGRGIGRLSKIGDQNGALSLQDPDNSAIKSDKETRTDSDLKKLITSTRDSALDGQLTNMLGKNTWIPPSELAFSINHLIADAISNSHDSSHDRILGSLLMRLHAHAPSSVTDALRGQLQLPQRIGLINFLRHQLFARGHTSSFNSYPASELSATPAGLEERDRATLPLETIVALLNCAVDAVGIAGWLGALAADNVQAGLVQDLRTEISMALTGVEEAAYLKGILREFLRYGVHGDGSALSSGKALFPTSGDVVPRPGEIITLYDEGWDQAEESNWLPLNPKHSRARVSETKIRKGNGEEITRSKREMRYLESKKVGKYSLERLVL